MIKNFKIRKRSYALSSPKPFEEQLLQPVTILLDNLSRIEGKSFFELKLQILEAASSRLGSYSLNEYHITFCIKPVAKYEYLDECGELLVKALGEIPIHPSLALSSLSREHLRKSEQRASGAYYTDFRLAEHIAKVGKGDLNRKSKVIDPACGAGILLVAVSLAKCNADRISTNNWLSNNVFAVDISEVALRGARLALASLTNDLSTIISMFNNWRCQDSLLMSKKEWDEVSSGGFDLVIGNPPWEKVRLTRHEYLQAQGDSRHYGSKYNELNSNDFLKEKNNISNYAEKLLSRYSLLGKKEPDLYMAFLQLSSRLVKQGGKVSILVPAGLIRSNGTENLRRYIFDEGRKISFTVMENRARFFSIDTRFKFLVLTYTRKLENIGSRKDSIRFCHATGSNKGVEQTTFTLLPRGTLIKVRPDLSIPEVKNKKEWNIFVSMSRNGVNWSNPSSNWSPYFVREVDMTKHRPNFKLKQGAGDIPVIEGRMVQAHRFGVKAYMSGSGRRAKWSLLPMGCSQVRPQFWINQKYLSPGVLSRYKNSRAGFCDIAGQTNERSMAAALIPSGVVCGNKVPTVVFPNDFNEDRLFLWIAIANSIPFDWMLRRVLTTTVNYFLLLGLPLPEIEPNTIVGRILVQASRKLSDLDTSEDKYDSWRMAELRADIDVSVLISYGLKYKDLEIMLADFPLLDRGQPSILNEAKSTITSDFLLLRAAKRFKKPTEDLELRVELSRESGAVPYIPSELSASDISNVRRRREKNNA